MGTIKLIKSGFYSTIQDIGRYGFQQYGMPVSGAMDEFAFKVGNILAGNNQNTPSIEFTYGGLTVEFLSSAWIAITGGGITANTSDGQDLVSWRTYNIKEKTTLKIDNLNWGCRGYLSIYGGFEIPKVMGSASTYIRGKIGGFEGRLLKEGDTLLFDQPSPQLVFRYVPETLLKKWYLNDSPIRVIMGPQAEGFSKDSIDIFLNSYYTITGESDRMGYRLQGPEIKHKTGPDIISDGIALGSIQVPGNGMPVILLADRQTAGGYTKIATVVTVDLPRLAQMGPGSQVRFKSVSIEEAHSLLKEFHNDIDYVQSLIVGSMSKNYILKIKERAYNITVEELLK